MWLGWCLWDSTTLDQRPRHPRGSLGVGETLRTKVLDPTLACLEMMRMMEGDKWTPPFFSTGPRESNLPVGRVPVPRLSQVGYRSLSWDCTPVGNGRGSEPLCPSEHQSKGPKCGTWMFIQLIHVYPPKMVPWLLTLVNAKQPSDPLAFARQIWWTASRPHQIYNPCCIAWERFGEGLRAVWEKLCYLIYLLSFLSCHTWCLSRSNSSLTASPFSRVPHICQILGLWLNIWYEVKSHVW